MKVIIFKEIPKHELNDSAINKRETITFQTNTSVFGEPLPSDCAIYKVMVINKVKFLLCQLRYAVKRVLNARL